MKMSAAKFKDEFRELVLRFLWRQWSALGVAGYDDGGDSWIIDPEALLLFSTTAATADPRLFDEILDWLVDQASWISLQRLPRLQREHELGSATVLAGIASHLERRHGHRKWKVLCDRTPVPCGESNRLFADLPQFGESDPDFLEWGWRRPLINHRRLSVRPSPDRPEAFFFKLRSLLGRQARVEILAWLLAHQEGHPAEIARQTGYVRRTIQQTLNEMEFSGHIRSVRKGREKLFFVLHHEWNFLVAGSPESEAEFPAWIQWPLVFKLLTRFHTLLANASFDSLSDHARAIETRKTLNLEGLIKAGLPAHLLPRTTPSDPTFWNESASRIRELLRTQLSATGTRK